MTCRHISSLLEEYVDNELTLSQKNEIEKHLQVCSNCRIQFQEATKLKEALSSLVVVSPPDTYWAETTLIILAKTAEAENSFRNERLSVESYYSSKSALIRSALSFVVAIFVLISAVIIGSMPTGYPPVTEINRNVVYSAELIDNLNLNNYYFVTKDEKNKISRGMLLLGTPGLLGRSAIFSDLVNFGE